MDFEDVELPVTPLNQESLQWEMDTPLIEPPIFKEMEHQVAGHSKTKGQRPLLQNKTERKILKPLEHQTKEKTSTLTISRGQVEQKFYEEYANLIPQLLSKIPHYYGTKAIESENHETTYLILEDLTSNFSKPNVMDIKIGKYSFDRFATEYKKQYEMSKFPLQMELGFRICGLKKFNSFEQEYETKDSKFGNSLQNKDQVLHVLRSFLDQIPLPLLQDVYMSILKQCQDVKQIFEQPIPLEFVASSVLFVVEGDEQIWKQFLENPNSTPIEELIRVKLIDFAHVYPWNESNLCEKKIDENLLLGFQTLVQLFEQLSSNKL